MPVRAFAVSPRTGDIILVGAPEASNPDKIFTEENIVCRQNFTYLKN